MNHNRRFYRARAALRIAVLSTPVVLAAAATSHSVLAAPLYWDGDGIGTVGGGAGIWDPSLARWSSTPAGSTYGPFNAADDATFGNTPAPVQLGTNAAAILNANSLVFASSNYLLVNPSNTTAEINLASGVVDTGVNDATVSARFAGGNFIKNGSGTLTFNAANTYTGSTFINGGTLALGNTAVADLPDLTDVQITAGARLDLSGNALGAYSDTVGSLEGAGSVTFGSTPFTTSSLTVGGNHFSTTFSGALSGAGGRFAKTGSGTMVLSGVNTIGGSVTVNAGILRLENGGAIPNGTPLFVNPLFDSGGVLLGGGTVELGTTETVGGLGGGFATGTPLLVNLNGNNLTVANARNIAYNGVITGTGNLTKSGAGTQALTNANSNFIGNVLIDQGILVASRELSLGQVTNDVILAGGTLSNFQGAGVTHTAGRDFLVTSLNGGMNVLQSGTGSVTMGISGIVSGDGQLTKGGPGRLDLNGANIFSGGMIVQQGTIGTLRTNGTPFGRGSLDMRTGFMVLNPAGSAGAALNIASDAGGTMTYGPGVQIQANRGSNPLFTLRIGDPAAASSSLLRGTNGTITLLPNSLINLGNPAAASRDEIYVHGGLPVTNGIVSPSIVSWQSTGGSQGDYLTYGANGLAAATYTGGADINAAGATSVFKASVAQTLSNHRAVYALNAHTQAITLGDGAGGYALTIGDGVNPAGMIMNVGGAINAGPVAGSSLVFNGPEAVIYTQNTAVGAINVPLSITGTGGLVKFGYGSLTLNAPASFAGPTTIGQGLIRLGVNDALPITTTVNLMGQPASDNTAAASNFPTLRLNAFNQTIAALRGDNNAARVDLGTGTLLVDQAINTTYAGIITGTNTGATQGTLHKIGIGTLTLSNVTIGPTAGTSFPNLYGKLRITGGPSSTVAVGSVNVLPATTPGTFSPDAVFIDDNARLRWTGINTLDSNLTPTSVMNQTAGWMIGAGGATIEVINSNETLIVQDVGVQSTDPLDPNFNRRNFAVHDIAGSGNLTKAGPGTLRLYANALADDPTGVMDAPIANSYTGRTIVTLGTLQIREDGALGAVPGALVPDQLEIRGGAALQTLAATTLAANRGVTIGTGGGTLYTSSSLALDGPLAGAGTLTKVGGSSLTLNAASPSFSGGITLTNGQTNFQANGAAGSGTITVSPQFPVTIGKATSGSTTLANNVTLSAGAAISFDIAHAIGILHLSGNVAGPNGLTKTGPGTLRFSGTSSIGAAIVSSGTLELGGPVANFSALLVQEGGRVVVAPLATRVVNTPQIAIASTGKIDLKDNKLITEVAVGSATASVYNGISGEIQRARNGGAWDQPGLTTSMPDALTNLTSIGVMSAAQKFGLAGGATATFAGQTVTATSTLAMYTYAGDANLDGFISGDDYTAIDFAIAQPGANGWSNGDFNYDGIISGDDYSAIDFNIVAQGTAFPTSGGTEFTGVTAVPEPALGGIAIVAVSLAGRRRRRRHAR